jgi:endonuclease IV
MIKIGPAGSDGLGNLKGIQKVARMKLDCMEVEFTYGVRMSMDHAREVGALAKEKGIVLSVHAPYYINLASDEKEKIVASKKRILDSCERAAVLGARNVVFHAGFYQKKTAAQTYGLIKKAIVEIQKKISKNRWKVKLCPEITGKPSQFGSVEELPQSFHAHFSGIAFGEKGERKHLNTTPSFFKPLAEALLKTKRNVTLINESPRPHKDAAMMKRVVSALSDAKK